MTRLLASLAFAWLALIAGESAASAMKIEKITSPAGIEAWLVREQTVPLTTLSYSFHGGSSQDEPDKSGTAHLAADMLDEGAGGKDALALADAIVASPSELTPELVRG